MRKHEIQVRHGRYTRHGASRHLPRGRHTLSVHVTVDAVTVVTVARVRYYIRRKRTTVTRRRSYRALIGRWADRNEIRPILVVVLGFLALHRRVRHEV